MRITWNEIVVKPLTPPNFKTHLKYISHLNSRSQNLKLKHRFNLKEKMKKNDDINKKINLIKLIKTSLDEEYKVCSSHNDFSAVCCLWIPTKSYYLMFNVWVVLCYLIKGSSLTITHQKLHQNLKELFRDKHLIFIDKKEFNDFYSHKELLEFKTKPGEILRSDVASSKIFKSLLRKIAHYKLDDLRRKVKDFRTKKGRKIKKEFVDDNLHICEFFYWYRIKANYRDLEFLNQDISSREFFKFYKNYFELTNNFYNAFKELVNDIAKIRFGKELIK